MVFGRNPGFFQASFLSIKTLERVVPAAFLALLVFLIPARGQDMAVPSDFEITLTSAALMRTSPPDIETVTLHADGTVEYSPKEWATGQLPAGEDVLPEDSVASVYQAVIDDDFFALESLYRDPEVQDGDYALMRVTANGRTHQVKTVNIKVTAFDRIVETINRQLPEERQVSYNALHVADYRQVER